MKNTLLLAAVLFSLVSNLALANAVTIDAGTAGTPSIGVNGVTHYYVDQNVGVDTIKTSLEAGFDVVIESSDDSVTWAFSTELLLTDLKKEQTLRINSANHILFDAASANQVEISVSGLPLNIHINPNRGSNGIGSFAMLSGNITTNGGDFLVFGGSNFNDYAVGDVRTIYSSKMYAGIFLGTSIGTGTKTSSINTGAGDIIMKGMAADLNHDWVDIYNLAGIKFRELFNLETTSGAIKLEGTFNSRSTTAVGSGVALFNNVKNSSVITDSGVIEFTGFGKATDSTPTKTYGVGLYYQGNSSTGFATVKTNTGDIKIFGYCPSIESNNYAMPVKISHYYTQTLIQTTNGDIDIVGIADDEPYLGRSVELYQTRLIVLESGNITLSSPGKVHVAGGNLIIQTKDDLIVAANYIQWGMLNNPGTYGNVYNKGDMNVAGNVNMYFEEKMLFSGASDPYKITSDPEYNCVYGGATEDCYTPKTLADDNSGKLIPGRAAIIGLYQTGAVTIDDLTPTNLALMIAENGDLWQLDPETGKYVESFENTLLTDIARHTSAVQNSGVVANNLDIIINYALSSNNPEPTLATYTDIAIKGVTSDNLAQINALVAVQAPENVDTIAKVQALVDELVAENKIVAYAAGVSDEVPSVNEYLDTGFSGVTTNNIEPINAMLLASDTATDAVSIQAAIDAYTSALAQIKAYAQDNSNPAPAHTTYQAIGLSWVNATNILSTNDSIAVTDYNTILSTYSVQVALHSEVNINLSGEETTYRTETTDSVTFTGGAINVDTINAVFDSGRNVVIRNSEKAQTNTDININADFSYTANKLNLTADRNININAVVSVNNTGVLALWANKNSYNDLSKPVFEQISADNIRLALTLVGRVRATLAADDSGFNGRIDFDRIGNNILSINGDDYRLVDSLAQIRTVANSTLDDDSQRIALANNFSQIQPITSGSAYFDNTTSIFRGRFDGLGHTVSSYTATGATEVSFFGKTGYDAIIRNVGLTDIDVTTTNYNVGAISSSTTGVTLHNVFATGTISGTSYRYGGLIGYISGTTNNILLTDIFCAVNVKSSTASAGIGGLIGVATQTVKPIIIHQSHATGAVDVSGAGDEIGGFIGTVTGDDANSFFILDSYSLGNVNAILPKSTNDRVGGFIGEVNRDLTLDNVFAAGDVYGNDNVGGLIGGTTAQLSTRRLSINNAYASGNVYGFDTTLGDDIGGLIGEVLKAEFTNISNVFSYGDVTNKSTNKSTDSGSLFGSVNTAIELINAHWKTFDGQSGVGSGGALTCKNDGVVTIDCGLTVDDFKKAGTFSYFGPSEGTSDDTSVWTWESTTYDYPILTSLNNPIQNAFAVSPSLISTDDATLIGKTATVNATVEPNGAIVELVFEYGLTTAYGQSSTVQTLVTGTGNKEVSLLLAGLTAQITYHYRAVAYYADGYRNIKGDDKTFTTTGSSQINVEVVTGDFGQFDQSGNVCTFDDDVTIGIDTLNTAYQSCDNVVVRTGPLGATLVNGKGQLSFSAELTLADNKTLTLIADHDLNINAPIIATATDANVALYYNQIIDVADQNTDAALETLDEELYLFAQEDETSVRIALGYIGRIRMAMAPNNKDFIGKIEFGNRSGNDLLNINGDVVSVLSGLTNTAGLDFDEMLLDASTTVINKGYKYALGQDFDATNIVPDKTLWGDTANFFKATFYGLGHSIDNVFFADATGKGIFPALKGAHISNLAVNDFSRGQINTTNTIGGLTPSISGDETMVTALNNMMVSGVIFNGGHSTGGIAGASQRGLLLDTVISDISFTTAFTSNTYAAKYTGGLIGSLTGEAIVFNSSAIGSLENTPKANFYAAYSNDVGGLLGKVSINDDSAKSYVLNSYSSVDINKQPTPNASQVLEPAPSESLNSGGTAIGGLIGHLAGKGTMFIANSFNSGSIRGINQIGGLVGFQTATTSLTINNAFNSGDIIGFINTSPNFTAGGLIGEINANKTTLNNVFNIGKVLLNDSGYSGGLIAEVVGGTLSFTNVYYNSDDNAKAVGVEVALNVIAMPLASFGENSFADTLGDPWVFNDKMAFPLLTGIAYLPQFIAGATGKIIDVTITDGLAGSAEIIDGVSVFWNQPLVGALTLQNALNLGDVIVKTGGSTLTEVDGVTELGDLVIDGDLSFAKNSLTLLAAHDIALSSAVSVTGKGYIDLDADTYAKDFQPYQDPDYDSQQTLAALATRGRVIAPILNDDSGFEGYLDITKTGYGALKMFGHRYWALDDLTELEDYSNNEIRSFALGQKIGSLDTESIFTVNSSIFLGNVDGLGHSINSYRYVRGSSGTKMGLIAYGINNTIRNIHLNDIRIDVQGDHSTNAAAGTLIGDAGHPDIHHVIASGYVNATSGGPIGGLVGNVYYGGSKFDNVSSTVDVTSAAGKVGGIAGYLRLGTIVTNVHSTGDVRSNGQYAGGFFGINTGKVMLDSVYVTGTVNPEQNDITDVGGLIGNYFGEDIAVSNAFTSGDIFGSTKVGGLVGYVGSADKVVIQNVYSTGDIEAADRTAGGIIGEATWQNGVPNAITVENAFSVGEIKGGSSAGGIIGEVTGSSVDPTHAGFVGNYVALTNDFWLEQLGNAGQLCSVGASNVNTCPIAEVTDGESQVRPLTAEQFAGALIDGEFLITLLLDVILPEGSAHPIFPSFGQDTQTGLAQVPLIKSTSATPESTNSVTLSVTFNPNNAIASISFEYGLDTSYGSTVTLPDTYNGLAEVYPSQTLSDLAVNTQYHYRAVITYANGSKSVYSSDAVFMATPMLPIDVTVTSGANGTFDKNDSVCTFDYDAQVGVDTIADAYKECNEVVIRTGPEVAVSIPSVGNIFFDANLTLTGSQKLTLIADVDVQINATITAGDNSIVSLKADNNSDDNGDPFALANTARQVREALKSIGRVRVGMFANDSGFKGSVEFGSRSGTGFLTINDDDYYVIKSLTDDSTSTDFDEITVNNINVKYALGTDLTSSSETVKSVVGAGAQGSYFKGTLNGLGHSIIALNIDKGGFDGLFSSVKDAYISNLAITKFSSTDNGNTAYLGAIAGYSAGGVTLHNIFVQGMALTLNGKTGGLFGNFTPDVGSQSLFEYVTTDLNITGGSALTGGNEIGGLFGFSAPTNRPFIISNTHTIGDIDSSLNGMYIGGFFGRLASPVSDYQHFIIDSYSTVNINKNTHFAKRAAAIPKAYSIGGLIGYSARTNMNIDRVYTSGDIMGAYKVGGLIGHIDDSTTGNLFTISNTYTSGNVLGVPYGNSSIFNTAGAFIGEINIGENLSITNSFSYGQVIHQDKDFKGGLFGGITITAPLLTNVFYNGDVNLSYLGTAVDKSRAKTIAQFAALDMGSNFTQPTGFAFPVLTDLAVLPQFLTSLNSDIFNVEIVAGAVGSPVMIDGVSVFYNQSTIGVDAITDALANGDVIIKSGGRNVVDLNEDNFPDSYGDISVNADINLTQNKLTLLASHDVLVNAIVDVSASATIDIITDEYSNDYRPYLNTADNLTTTVNALKNHGKFRTPIKNDDSALTGRIDIAGLGHHIIRINGESFDVINAFNIFVDATRFTKEHGRFALGKDYGTVDVATSYTVKDIDGFYGKFDGLGHRLNSLVISRVLDGRVPVYSGLFEEAYNSTIRNLHLSNVQQSSTNNQNTATGALIGYGSNPVIHNVLLDGVVNNAGSNTGGLAGVVSPSAYTLVDSVASSLTINSAGNFTGGLFGSGGGLIYNSHTTGDIFVDSNTAGGLLGSGEHSKISNAYTSGNINAGKTTTSVNVGGLIGALSQTGNVQSDIYISNAFASGDVFGGNSIGGIIGNIGANNTDRIIYATNIYTTGKIQAVDSTGNAGGLIGSAAFDLSNQQQFDISQAFSFGQIEGENAGGILGATTGTSIPADLADGFTNSFWLDQSDSSGIENSNLCLIGDGCGLPSDYTPIRALTKEQFTGGEIDDGSGGFTTIIDLLNKNPDDEEDPFDFFENSSGGAYPVFPNFAKELQASLAIRPTIVTIAPLYISDTQIKLQAIVDTFSQLTDFSFEFGVDTNYGTSYDDNSTEILTVGEQNIVSVVVPVGAATTYHYRAKGVHANGETFSNDFSFTVAGLKIAVDVFKAYAVAANAVDFPPSVADYTNAGIIGVTDGNFERVNQEIFNQTEEAAVDTSAEIQAIVGNVTALIEIFEDSVSDSDGISNANGTAVSFAQLSAITDLNNEIGNNITAYQAAIAAEADFIDLPTLAQVQAIIDRVNAGQIIASYTTDVTNVPIEGDYTAIDVVGVDSDNLPYINAAINALSGPSAADSQAEVQAVVDSTLAIIEVLEDSNSTDGANNGNNSAITLNQLSNIQGLTGLVGDNIAAYQAEIAAETGFSNPPTLSEIQLVIDRANAREIIKKHTTDPTAVPSINDYVALGVSGVSDANLAKVNQAINALTSGDKVDSAAKVQAIVNGTLALFEVLEDSASTGGANNTNGSAISVVQLQSIVGLTDINPAAIAYYQSEIAAASDFDNLPTLAQVQAIIDRVNSAPVVNNDVATLTEGGSVIIDALANDSGSSITLDSASAVSGGITIVNGALLYQAPANFVGSDIVEYIVMDKFGNRSLGVINVTVEIDTNLGAIPIIIAPTDIETNAAGLITQVTLGSAVATDSDGQLLAVTTTSNNRFEPGVHYVTWLAQDDNGRIASVMQKITIHPQVTMAVNRSVSEGKSVVVGVYLNGNAPVYPLTVAYTLSGSATSSDHNLVDGSVTFDNSQIATITFDTLVDGVSDNGETLIITLSPLVNVGGNDAQIITIFDSAVAPVVTLKAYQNTIEQRAVDLTSGFVTVRMIPSDGSPLDYNVVWTPSINGLANLSNEPGVFVFDPSTLGEGNVSFVAQVTDSNGLSTNIATNVALHNNLDPLNPLLDATKSCSVAPEQLNDKELYLVEAQPQVCITNGDFALVDNPAGLQVLNHQQALPDDAGMTNIGGMFDYLAYGLVPASSYQIVFPQRAPIPDSAVFRKLKGGITWVDFSVTSNDYLSSSMSVQGLCPAPGDNSWVKGLIAGNWCVQVTITDGGPNDDDGLENGIVVDPGGVAMPDNGNSAPVANDDVVTVLNGSDSTLDVLANDSDSNGDSLTVIAFSADLGNVALVNGKIVYTPPTPGFIGVDNITYTISDGNGGFATASISLTVAQLYSAPVANGQSASLVEDTPKAIVLVATDLDGDELTYIIDDIPTNGSLTVIGANVTYTPDSNFVGVDSFSYHVSDGVSDSAIALISLTVTSVNDAPVAKAQSVTTAEDMAVAIHLIASDADGDSLTYTVDTSPSNGNVTGTAPNVTYTPNGQYNGSDSFTFKVNDGSVDSTIETISITVTAVNDAPIAVADTATVVEDTSNNIINVLSNDSDIDGGVLTITAATSNYGTMTFVSGTSLSYTPTSNFEGSDVITYSISDGIGGIASTTVLITVTAVNDPPVAINDSSTVVEDGAVIIDVLDNDSDVDGNVNIAGVNIVTPPANGVVSVNAISGKVTYTPNSDYFGSDSFSYKLIDNEGLASNTSIVSVTVTGVEDSLVVVDDLVTTDQNVTSNKVNVFANDIDVDNALDVVSVSVIQPLNGSATIDNNGLLIFIPDVLWVGETSLQYSVTDSSGVVTNTATVTIIVKNVGDTTPVAVDDSANVPEDTLTSINVLINDTTSDILDVATVTIVTQPVYGTVTVNTDGTIDYMPTLDSELSDSFSYVVKDSRSPALISNVATVSLDIISDNDAPVAVLDTITVDYELPTMLNILANDSDSDNTLSVSDVLVSGLTAGSIDSSSGSMIFTPGASFTGTTFTYTVSDDTNVSNSVTVTLLTTDPVINNVAPQTFVQTVNVAEDTSYNLVLLAIDVDNDVSELTYSYANPTNGTLSGTGPDVIYTPNADFYGVDSFTFSVDDLSNTSNTSIVTINVNAVNDVPIANDLGVIAVDEDTAKVVVLSAVDVENSSLTYALVDFPLHGILSGTAPNLSYTPAPGYSGPDSFTYIVTDADGGVSTIATIELNVTASNDKPMAYAQLLTTTEDMPIDLVLTATDQDGDNLSYFIISQPTKGTLTGTAPNLTYKPNADSNGTDSFSFKVNDTTLDSDVVDVSINVIAINDAPTGSAQSVDVAEDSNLNITLGGIDLEGNSLTYIIVGQPLHGSLSGLAPNLVYVPDANYNGSDSFTFRVSDGAGFSALTTVSISVTNTNDAPVSNPISVTTTEETAVSIVLSATDIDGDGLFYAVLANPVNGQLTGTLPNLSYTPVLDFVGSDSFTYSVNDGFVSSGVVTVSITVTGTNDAPVADAQTISVNKNDTVSVVLSGSDVDGDDISYLVTTAPENGVLTGTAPNLSYQSNSDYVGSDRFEFKVLDSTNTASVIVVVSLEILETNIAPIASASSVSALADTAVEVLLVASDFDNDVLNYQIMDSPAHGSLSGTAPQLTYTPALGFVGNDRFTFKVNDGIADSETVTVSITIDKKTDLPIANDDSYQLSNWDAILLDVLANDYVPEQSQISILSFSASIGTVVIVDGQLSYQPVNGFIGTTNIDYTIIDNSGYTSTALVLITIDSNEGPIITLPQDLCQDLTVNATGLYTRVELGTATAVDRFGNDLPVSLVDGNVLFPPGLNEAFWQATDGDGVTTIKSQKVCVNPLVSFQNNQVVAEGVPAKIGIYLNGVAPVYPLTINFGISGSSDGNDHTLTNGEVIIYQGHEVFITFVTLDDSLVESDETLIVTFDDDVNQGAKSSHQLTITEAHVAAKATFNVYQQNEERFVVSQDGGLVSIIAQIGEHASNVNHVISWQQDDINGLNQSDKDSQLIFDPATLATGRYLIILSIQENSDTSVVTRLPLYIEVVATLAPLTSIDSDGDSIPDNEEGYQDSDGDLIPDYLDRIDECNVLQEAIENQDGYLIEGDSGVCLRLGFYTVNGETGGAQLTDIDIAEGRDDQLIEDPDAINIGGIFDYVAYGLSEEGEQYSIVMPQRKPVPVNAIYRKFSHILGWHNFITDAENSLWSTAGEPGYCPPPNNEDSADNLWKKGLKEGDWCVQLVIKDGGANDDDGLANGTIVDPGGVAVQKTNNNLPMAIEDNLVVELNGQTTIDVLVNDTDADGDNLTITSVVTSIGVGTIVNQKIHYQSAFNYSGKVLIQYGISDGNGGTDIGLVHITTLVNTPPSAVSDSVTTDNQTAVTIDVMANDSDIDGDQITITLASVDIGTVAVIDNKILYTPSIDFVGVATIEYQITDTSGTNAMGIVSVTVTAADIGEGHVVENESGGGDSQTLLLLLSLLMIIRMVTLSKNTQLTKVLFLMLCWPLASNAKDVEVDHYFFEGHFVKVTGNVSNGVYQDKLLIIDPTAQLLAVEDDRTGKRFAFGAMYNNDFSLELGWLDMGKTKLKFYSEAVNIEQVIEQSQAIYPASGRGLYVAGAYHYQLAKDLVWKNSVGLWFWPQKRNIYLDGDFVKRTSRRQEGILFDSSLRFKVDDNLRLSLGVTMTPLAQVRSFQFILGAAWYFK